LPKHTTWGQFLELGSFIQEKKLRSSVKFQDVTLSAYYFSAVYAWGQVLFFALNKKAKSKT
jgi:hypothetical protein